MALQRQNLNISFIKGLDTKTDPFQVPAGKFLALSNSVFDKAGRLTKRNGFGELTTLPNANSTFLTTFQGDLTAIGSDLLAYAQGPNIWVDKGSIMPTSLNTLKLVQNNTNQIQADSAISPNNLICTGYTDSNGVSNEYRYVIADSITGQNVLEPTTITDADPTYGAPKVFLLGNYFIVVYNALITGTHHLRYIAISYSNPVNPLPAVDLSTTVTPALTAAFDGTVINNRLYLAYNGSDIGGAIRYKFLSSTLSQSNEVVLAGQTATIVSVTADAVPAIPNIYISYYDVSTMNGFTFVVNANLILVTAPVHSIAGFVVSALTSTANNGVDQLYYEVDNNYGYDSSIPTHFINNVSVTQSGTIGATAVLIRSVGLASKSFLLDGVIYFLGIYYSLYQPTYFLINQSAKILSKLAYSNGGNYYALGLPNVTVTDNIAQVPYIFKDLVEAINKTQGAVVSAGVYAQTGVALASFTLGVTLKSSSEIGSVLSLSGGFLWSYDGFEPVENNFFVWPDNVETTVTLSGGSMADAVYFYQVTYEWADNQGNLIRSAPSIPVTAVVSGGGGAASVTLNIPTLRLTYKITNPVKIVIYRWSNNQQTYFQTTSISVPTLNDTSVDYITYVDIHSDAQIVGNNIIYTNGGVIEDISPPATDIITLFNNRLWLVDAEDRNLLWFSKQVIEDTTVEMSDLLTLYVAPTTASEGSTGPITALAPMDDKLIVFKANALGYINGIGPDNTGANNQYSDFTLINSVVGCTNQPSIVFTPAGLMFQTNKGIWLVSRDLSTQYIGAPVESYTTGAIVLSAINIPATNQVRFTLDSGITLMYDYYFGEWATFNNIPAISSTIYNNLHTYLDSFGRVFQETEGKYLDNTSPVLMSFTSNWLNLAGVQGFERFYQMYLLGTYITPFKLNVQLAYNYNSSLSQQTIVTPSAPTADWGGDALWGSSSPWGGPGNVFQARVFPQIQKCESFQISINEIYDPSYGLAAGAGLTLSGMNLVAGLKKGYRTQSAGRSFG